MLSSKTGVPALSLSRCPTAWNAVFLGNFIGKVVEDCVGADDREHVELCERVALARGPGAHRCPGGVGQLVGQGPGFGHLSSQVLDASSPIEGLEELLVLFWFFWADSLRPFL